ncbi:hypothetical protein H4R34_001170 [Dimargaris verticillata]|uniref:Uncharacterized protein n=1 Tax=Dimargaris verticillata TaxID=2761393 RepID=A0A9W8BAI2_9FUNG|nr:hypothetical protein H4R34_001170 [Dimargaris verticillata]
MRSQGGEYSVSSSALHPVAIPRRVFNSPTSTPAAHSHQVPVQLATNKRSSASLSASRPRAQTTRGQISPRASMHTHKPPPSPHISARQKLRMPSPRNPSTGGQPDCSDTNSDHSLLFSSATMAITPRRPLTHQSLVRKGSLASLTRQPTTTRSIGPTTSPPTMATSYTPTTDRTLAVPVFASPTITAHRYISYANHQPPPQPLSPARPRFSAAPSSTSSQLSTSVTSDVTTTGVLSSPSRRLSHKSLSLEPGVLQANPAASPASPSPRLLTPSSPMGTMAGARHSPAMGRRSMPSRPAYYHVPHATGPHFRSTRHADGSHSTAPRAHDLFQDHADSSWAPSTSTNEACAPPWQSPTSPVQFSSSLAALNHSLQNLSTHKTVPSSATALGSARPLSTSAWTSPLDALIMPVRRSSILASIVPGHSGNGDDPAPFALYAHPSDAHTKGGTTVASITPQPGSRQDQLRHAIPRLLAAGPNTAADALQVVHTSVHKHVPRLVKAKRSVLETTVRVELAVADMQDAVATLQTMQSLNQFQTMRHLLYRALQTMESLKDR